MLYLPDRFGPEWTWDPARIDGWHLIVLHNDKVLSLVLKPKQLPHICRRFFIAESNNEKDRLNNADDDDSEATVSVCATINETEVQQQQAVMLSTCFGCNAGDYMAIETSYLVWIQCKVVQKYFILN